MNNGNTKLCSFGYNCVDLEVDGVECIYGVCITWFMVMVASICIPVIWAFGGNVD